MADPLSGRHDRDGGEALCQQLSNGVSHLRVILIDKHGAALGHVVALEQVSRHLSGTGDQT